MTSAFASSRLGGRSETGSSRTGGGGGGGKNIEKRLVIFKKEIEKMIKEKNAKQDEGFSKAQKKVVKDMMNKDMGKMVKRVTKLEEGAKGVADITEKNF